MLLFRLEILYLFYSLYELHDKILSSTSILPILQYGDYSLFLNHVIDLILHHILAQQV